MTGVNCTVLAPQEKNGPTTTKRTRESVEEQRRRGSGFDGSNANFAGVTTVAPENSLTTKDPSVVSKQGGEGDGPFS
jgi:hypothetical protein